MTGGQGRVLTLTPPPLVLFFARFELASVLSGRSGELATLKPTVLSELQFAMLPATASALTNHEREAALARGLAPTCGGSRTSSKGKMGVGFMFGLALFGLAPLCQLGNARLRPGCLFHHGNQCGLALAKPLRINLWLILAPAPFLPAALHAAAALARRISFAPLLQLHTTCHC